MQSRTTLNLPGIHTQMEARSEHNMLLLCKRNWRSIQENECNSIELFRAPECNNARSRKTTTTKVHSPQEETTRMTEPTRTGFHKFSNVTDYAKYEQLSLPLPSPGSAYSNDKLGKARGMGSSPGIGNTAKSRLLSSSLCSSCNVSMASELTQRFHRHP